MSYLIFNEIIGHLNRTILIVHDNYFVLRFFFAYKKYNSNTDLCQLFKKNFCACCICNTYLYTRNIWAIMFAQQRLYCILGYIIELLEILVNVSKPPQHGCGPISGVFYYYNWHNIFNNFYQSYAPFLYFEFAKCLVSRW